MSLETGIYQEMKSDTGVASLVGNRIFGSRFPGNTTKPTLPAIVYFTYWSDTIRALDGPAALRFKKVQIDCYGEKYPDAVELADAVRVLFEGFKGTLTNGVVVQSAEIQSEQDFTQEPGHPTQGFVYRRILEIVFRYVES
jgi:hypothetical protein